LANIILNLSLTSESLSNYQHIINISQIGQFIGMFLPSLKHLILLQTPEPWQSYYILLLMLILIAKCIASPAMEGQ